MKENLATPSAEAITRTASRRQRTLAGEAVARGVGFLTGAEVQLRFRPAAPDTGIVFIREDLPNQPEIPARLESVVPRQRRTSIQRGEATVEMVEHVLAALSGLGIDNCRVGIDGGETPGCDGSSRVFTEALVAAGRTEQDQPRAILTVKRPVTVSEGPAALTALPNTHAGLTLSYTLDYGADSPIHRQALTLDVTPDTFRNALAPSRTFLLEEEAQLLRQAGIGLNTQVEDLLVFGPDGPIHNTLRFPDECVRHKMLDMVGDLALLGMDLHGQVIAHRSGHHLNVELARRLAADQDFDPENVPPPEMDIQKILSIMPHRSPMLLVDRVLELEPGRRIKALKNVTCSEPHFQGHWPELPVMPGVLIIEALAQAGGLLVWSTRQGGRAVLASVDKSRFRHPVVPGDQILLEVALERSKVGIYLLQGKARVGRLIVAEAQIRLVVNDE